MKHLDGSQNYRQLVLVTTFLCTWGRSYKNLLIKTNFFGLIQHTKVLSLN